MVSGAFTLGYFCKGIIAENFLLICHRRSRQGNWDMSGGNGCMVIPMKNKGDFIMFHIHSCLYLGFLRVVDIRELGYELSTPFGTIFDGVKYCSPS